MKEKLIVISIAASFLMIGCDQLPVNPNTSSYLPSHSDNYWVYERIQIDTNGIETPLGIYDTCFIEPDTVINGDTYYKYLQPNPYSSTPAYLVTYLKDSANYIVANPHYLYFSSDDFTTIFSNVYIFGPGGNSDTLARVERKMDDQNLSISVPAGNFITSNVKETYYMYPPYQTCGTERYVNKRLADNVGIVTQTLPFYVSSGIIVERRLVSFQLY